MASRGIPLRPRTPSSRNEPSGSSSFSWPVVPARRHLRLQTRALCQGSKGHRFRRGRPEPSGTKQKEADEAYTGLSSSMASVANADPPFFLTLPVRWMIWLSFIPCTPRGWLTVLRPSSFTPGRPTWSVPPWEVRFPYGLGTENENLPAYASICPMASKGAEELWKCLSSLHPPRYGGGPGG